MVSTTPEAADFPGAELFAEIQSRTSGGEWDSRYYVGSSGRDVARPRRVGARIRGHWSVENKNHWRKDATLREDDTRSRNPRIVSNLILLRNLVLLYHARHAEDGEWLTAWIESNQASQGKILRMVTRHPRSK